MKMMGGLRERFHSFCNRVLQANSRQMIRFEKAKYPAAKPSLMSLTMISLMLSCSGCAYLSAWQSRKGCEVPAVSAGPTYSVFVSPHFNAEKPRRIVMISSGETTGGYDETSRLISHLATKIRAVGAFEVIVPPNQRVLLKSDDILRGRFNEREMASIARKYNADAIALVRVNDFRAYAPMRTSVTMAIVDGPETIVAFAVDGSWDTSSPGVDQLFKKYIEKNSQSNPLATELSTVQSQSPDALLGFVASEIDQALQSTF